MYLDNPAGTQVPEVVLDRMRAALVEFNANMHGNFRTSDVATETVHQAHVAMADMYHAASPDEIVFGPNMTTLTFQMARVLGPLFTEGDEMITTHMEHDGNNTPWRTMAAERGMVVKTVPWNRETNEFDLDALDELITPRTRFASLNVASNILGTINPVKEMVARLKAVGAITYLDAVQYAPHGPIDVQDLGCDFLVSSSYKWYGAAPGRALRPHRDARAAPCLQAPRRPRRGARQVRDRLPVARGTVRRDRCDRVPAVGRDDPGCGGARVHPCRVTSPGGADPRRSTRRCTRWPSTRRV